MNTVYEFSPTPKRVIAKGEVWVSDEDEWGGIRHTLTVPFSTIRDGGPTKGLEAWVYQDLEGGNAEAWFWMVSVVELPSGDLLDFVTSGMTFDAEQSKEKAEAALMSAGWAGVGIVSRKRTAAEKRDFGGGMTATDLPDGWYMVEYEGGLDSYRMEVPKEDSEDVLEAVVMRHSSGGWLWDVWQGVDPYWSSIGSGYEYELEQAKQVAYGFILGRLETDRFVKSLSSRKQATPSDDLVEWDIEDYEGNPLGMWVEPQHGGAESQLPYAGDDTTPAFRETGWTARKGKSMSRRRKVASKYEWEETTSYDEAMGQEVPSETNLTILSENPDSEEFGYTIVTTVIDGSWSMIGVSQYGRELLALGKGGKSGAEDGIDRQVARMTGKGWTVVSKKRAVRKSASGFYDHGGGVVELGVQGGDNQVGNSYGRVFARQNADGTYDVVEVAYYAAVNSVMGDEADELIAADEVFVEEQTWEWKNIPSLDNYHDEEPYDITYRNDMLMTNVSLAEAERLAEEYARSLSSGGDYIASRKRSSRKRAAFMEWERDLGVSDGWMNATYGDDGTEYSVNIENVGGSYRWHLWAESESGMDMLENGSESSLDAAKSSAEAAAKRWMDEAKYASRRRSTRKRAEVDFDKPEVQPGSGAADVAGTHTPGQSEADYPQPSASQETAAEGWPVGLTPAESARLRRFRSAVKAYTAKQEPSRRRPARKTAEYSGWANHATWNVALWISNDEGLHEMAKEYDDYESFVEGLRELGVTETLDGVSFDDSSLDTDSLDEMFAELRSEGRRRGTRKAAEYSGWFKSVAEAEARIADLYRAIEVAEIDGSPSSGFYAMIYQIEDWLNENYDKIASRRPFVGSRGDVRRRGTRNRIRQMGAAKFDTSEYMLSHGKPPRGRGGWAFSPADGGASLPRDRGLSVDMGYGGIDIVWARGSQTLADAKREVAAAYPEVNEWTVLS